MRKHVQLAVLSLTFVGFLPGFVQAEERPERKPSEALPAECEIPGYMTVPTSAQYYLGADSPKRGRDLMGLFASIQDDFKITLSQLALEFPYVVFYKANLPGRLFEIKFTAEKIFVCKDQYGNFHVDAQAPSLIFHIDLDDKEHRYLVVNGGNIAGSIPGYNRRYVPFVIHGRTQDFMSAYYVLRTFGLDEK